MNLNNPFVGLRSFEMDESLLFFGRQDQVADILLSLHRFRFVAVVGSSGCGKSSLNRAGLIPALKAGYLLNEQDNWKILVMKPGESPLYNLSCAVNTEFNNDPRPAQAAALAKTLLTEGPEALLQLFRSPAGEQANVLLLVDQFEELFRFADLRTGAGRSEEAAEFVNLLLYLADLKELPVYVVITMRSDFIGDCDAFYGLPEAINQGLYLVPRLNRVQIKQAIEGPLKLYGLSINPMLTSRMLNEVQKTKDELPVLQHALMRICEKRAHTGGEGVIDFSDYEAIGGLEWALSRHADEAIGGLDAADLTLVEKIFQTLTAVDGNGRKIRRPAHLSALITLTGAPKEKIDAILGRFIAGNSSLLVVTSENPDDPVIDITHESLIRRWDKLSGWVDAEWDNSRSLMQLVDAATLWRQGKKDLLTATELETLSTWFHAFNPTHGWAKRYTLQAEQAFGYLGKSEAEDQRAKLALRRRQVKHRLMIRAISISLVLLLVAAFLVAVFIREAQQTTVRKQVFIARSTKNFYEQNYLEAFLYSVEANSLRSDDSLLIRCTKYFPVYGLRAIFKHPDEVDSAEFDANPALINVFVDSFHYRWNIPGDSLLSTQKFAPAPNPDEDTHSHEISRLLNLWGVDANGKVGVFDRSDGLRTADTIRYPRNLGIIYRIAFSPDKQRILTSGVLPDSLYGATIWDAATGSRIGSSLVHAGEIYGSVFSRDDQRIITYGQDSTARVWQLSPAAVLQQPDKDLPPDLLKLQAQVLTGAFINDTTSEVNYLPLSEWKTLRDQWLQEAQLHYEECRYPAANYWGLIYRPQDLPAGK
jgi:energy-coupling factor transporter ATP-binding protein EcfA2